MTTWDLSKLNSKDSPLSGLTVVSVEQAVAAPYCTCRLADAGARVIKIEREEGDFARHYDDVVNGQSAYFVWLNRGKESVVLDLKAEDGVATLQRLIRRADVFVQNLSISAAEKLGLTPAFLEEINPRLVSVDISGYGSIGPMRNAKAYDLLIQCETGLASITGSAGEPGRVGVSVCDIATGMYAYSSILEALSLRGKTGLGSHIQVSLFDSMADWMNVPYLHRRYGGKSPRRVGLNHATIAPYGLYECADDKSIVLAVQSQREWRKFCSIVLGDVTLHKNPMFETNSDRCRYRSELDSIISNSLGRKDIQTVIELLEDAGIAYGRLNSVGDLLVHPHLRTVTVSSDSGDVELVSPPAIHLRKSLGRVPALGEHTVAVQTEFGPGKSALKGQST